MPIAQTSRHIVEYLIVNWTHRNNIQWNMNQDTNLFIQENAYKIVLYNTTDIC